MIQQQFAQNAREILSADEQVLGLAVAGSWLTQEMDEYADLDLILVTRERISDQKHKMLEYAGRLGFLMSGFTGEHVGEPRVLICLYDDPLLHVDIKFLTLTEFESRIETPILLLDKTGELENAIHRSEGIFPYPDYQWIEDRFWIWIHYALLKIGRGEYMEAHDFMSFLRMTVFGPLLLIKNGQLPRGVRKVETKLPEGDLSQLINTLSACNKSSLLSSLRKAISLYQSLRNDLYDASVVLQQLTEKRVLLYLNEIEGCDE